jgi:hypothetical protein
MDTFDQATNQKRGFFELTVYDKANGPPLAAQPLSFKFCGTFAQVRDALKTLKDYTKLVWKENEHNVTQTYRAVIAKLDPLLANRWLRQTCCDKSKSIQSARCEVNAEPITTKLPRLLSDTDEQALKRQLRETRAFKMLAEDDEDEYKQLWHTALILCLDEDFWKDVEPTETGKLFERVENEEGELGREVREGRAKLRQLM